MQRIVMSAWLLLAFAGCAASADDFYKGKTITIINSTGNGGSYYNIAQALARHMPKYIPGNPAMIVKSMPGGGNVLATNFMYVSAPKDGTHIATINNSIPLHQALDGRGIQYDVTKFNWLGSTGTYNSIAYVWSQAGFKTIQDVFRREVILGGTGVGSSIVIYPAAMNSLLGARFKIVLGYKATSEIDLAMERGEVQARTGSYTGLRSDHPDWLSEKKIDILMQIGSKRDPELPHVPLLSELGRNEEERKILELISSPIALGRPYLAPPGVPADRLEMLRSSFARTLRDEGFLAEAQKMDHDIAPQSAEEIATIVEATIKAPPIIIQRAKDVMGPME